MNEHWLWRGFSHSSQFLSSLPLRLSLFLFLSPLSLPIFPSHSYTLVWSCTARLSCPFLLFKRLSCHHWLVFFWASYMLLFFHLVVRISQPAIFWWWCLWCVEKLKTFHGYDLSYHSAGLSLILQPFHKHTACRCIVLFLVTCGYHSFWADWLVYGAMLW